MQNTVLLLLLLLLLITRIAPRTSVLVTLTHDNVRVSVRTLD
jgi:hypothetical protein